MAKLQLIPLLVLLLPIPSNAGTVVQFIDPSDYLAGLRIISYEPGTTWKHEGGSWLCQIQISIGGDLPRFDKPTARGQVRYSQATSMGNEQYVCNGVDVSMKAVGNPPNMAIFNEAMRGFTRLRAASHGATWGPTRTYCNVTAGVHTPWYWNLRDTCTLEPTTTSCSIDATRLLDHGVVNIGRNPTNAIGTARLSCTSTTTVTISVNQDNVLLTDGPNTVESSVYIGAPGKTSQTITASPSATIPLGSIITDAGRDAGIYNGSFVVTATWD